MPTVAVEEGDVIVKEAAAAFTETETALVVELAGLLESVALMESE